jgi:ascorbate-specific PTS system EIIC-type component UlaA
VNGIVFLILSQPVYHWYIKNKTKQNKKISQIARITGMSHQHLAHFRNLSLYFDKKSQQFHEKTNSSVNHKNHTHGLSLFRHEKSPRHLIPRGVT